MPDRVNKGCAKKMCQREGKHLYKDTDIGEHIVYKKNTSRSILLGNAQFKINQFVLKMDGGKTRLGTFCVPCLGGQILFYRVIVSEVLQSHSGVAHSFCEHCSLPFSSCSSQGLSLPV